MSRRKKRILYTSLFSTAIFLLAGWHIWEDDERKIYLPGEEVQGVTTRLNREIPKDFNAFTFSDVTDKSGIDFTHFNHRRSSRLPEDMGSGLAWFDYDNDGWDDLFLLNYSLPLGDQHKDPDQTPSRSKLYRNNGDGTFTDVSKQSGLDLAVRGMGVAAADYDNDGWTDLIITTYGTNRLMKNNGDGTFTDVSKEAGIDFGPGFWAGASWGDFNRDGNPDLYITGYVKFEDFDLSGEKLAVEEPPSINPSSFLPERNLLYQNNGNGTFTEISRQTGTINATGRSLSASWVDVNNDLWPDLYVANDVSDNILYLNNGDGTFSDISHTAHVADYRGAMGLATGDWDGDLDMDLFVTHWIAQENALYTNRLRDTLQSSSGRLRFKDDSANHGLGQSSLDFVGWATAFTDFDLDSRPDIFIVNGNTIQYPDNPERLKPMTDQIYWNAGAKRGFYDVSKLSGSYFAKEFVGRGGAYADFDHDGDPDLAIINHGGKAVLLENNQHSGNHWLSIRLEGTESNRSAIGAHIRITTAEKVQVKQVGSQSSYLSHNSLEQHFGLGKHRKVDTLEIRWPGGKIDTFPDIKANQVLIIKEGSTESSIMAVN